MAITSIYACLDRLPLLGLMALAGVAPAAAVGTLDGHALMGPSLSFDAKGGTLTIGGTTVAVADCDWIEPGSGKGMEAASARTLGVWLADGSWFPVASLRAGEADNTLALTGPLGAMTLPLATMRGWGVGSEPPGPHGDHGEADQVLLDSGLVAGRIEGIVAGKLILHSDLDPGKPLELALEQVRGLRLAGAVKTSKGLRLSVALDETHPALRVVVGASGLSDAALRLAAAPQMAVGSALAPMHLRVEGGRRVYLGELTPEHVDEVGAFGVVWPWQRDHNLDGSPLKLGGIRYDHGVVVHSQARLSWKLAGAYAHLHALAGIADVVADQGDCAASLLADGKSLWSRDSVKGGDKPLPIELDLGGVQTLELHVDYGARYDIGDHFALADAYLVKVK